MLCDPNDSILEWLQKLSAEVSSLRPSSSAASTNIVEQPNTNNMDVNTLLQGTIKGKLIIEYYEQHKTLDTKNQKDICHLICDFVNSRKQKLTYADMQDWANSIEIAFPNEKSVSVIF